MTMTDIRILAIDDEIDFISALSRRLGRRGYVVRTTGTGREGLDALREESFDVVLLDVSMPDMDGIKVLGEIRKRHPMVPVVMLTAHANSDLVISSLAMGAYDYLMKPVKLEELARKVDEAVAKGRSQLARQGS